MDYLEQVEIDRLLSEIADEGPSPERMRQLDRLLVGRPDLQHYYSQAIGLHTLLAYEMDLSLQQLQPVCAPETSANYGLRDENDFSPAEVDCVELSHRIGKDMTASPNAGTFPVNRGRNLFYVAAVALAAVAVTLSLWRSGLLGDAATAGREAGSATPGNQAHDGGSNVQINDAGLVVRDRRALAKFSRLTRTAMLTKLELPRCAPIDTEPSSFHAFLCSGTAWMERSPGGRERGHLVALLPGQLMDVYVDTDAHSQNALGIVEINQEGRMTGGTISFTNLIEDNSSTNERRSGCIGNYSVLNDTVETKYYLFAGSHILPQQEVDDSWHQSDYRVLHNSIDLMVIGWDDSGYAYTPPEDAADRVPEIGDYVPDRDYDDIRAVVRFSQPGSSPISESQRGVSYLPQPEPGLQRLDESVDGYRLDVKPGEETVLMVSSSARWPNSIQIAQLPSRQVLWQHDGPGATNLPAQEFGQDIYLIRNDGETVRQYLLHARHKNPGNEENDGWETSPFKSWSDGDGEVTVGFEDKLQDPASVDWNDIRVHARWFAE